MCVHCPSGTPRWQVVVCWYSLMYLAPSDRPAAFRELARVVKAGGYLVTAFKAGDSELPRGGRSAGLGAEFDVYWLAPEEIQRRATDADFVTVFWGGRPGRGPGGLPHGYLIAQRPGRPGPCRANTLNSARSGKQGAFLPKGERVALVPPDVCYESQIGPNAGIPRCSRPWMTSRVSFLLQMQITASAPEAM